MINKEKLAKTAEKAWAYLQEAGLAPAGIAGLLGNLYAESGLDPTRVEQLCLDRLEEMGMHYTSKTYTASVDSGEIEKEDFLHPMPGKQYGYGMAQWTFPSRKEGLYDLAKTRGVSIGDLYLQLDYMMEELRKDFRKTVYDVLVSTNQTDIASNAVLMHYEAPGDIDVETVTERQEFAKAIYEWFADSESDSLSRADTGKDTGINTSSKKVTAKDVINIMASWIGYSEANGKHKEIIDIYNGYCAERASYPRGYMVSYDDAWCDTTVSAAFIKAGAVDLIGGIECGVEEHISIFRKAGIWQEDGTVTPKPGWIICYDWDALTQPNNNYADHIGIVETIAAGHITVIEGNYSGAVRRRKIPVGWGHIRGFAMPAYAQGSQTSSDLPEGQAAKPSPTEQSAGSLKPAEINKTEKWVGRVTASALNVRVWAGTQYSNIKNYPYLLMGNLVSVCDTRKDSSGNDWYYVKIADKYYGFVSAKYVKQA